MRTVAELIEAVEQFTDEGRGRSVPRTTTQYRLTVTPMEMREITEVRMSARRGAAESWNWEMASGLAKRFGKVPTVAIHLVLPESDPYGPPRA